MPGSTITLLTRPGCHLCDDARSVVTGIVARLAAAGREIGFDEQSIDGDAALHRRWTDEVPVVLVDGRVHSRWRVDPQALVAELTA